MAIDLRPLIEERALVRLDRTEGLEPCLGVPVQAEGDLVLLACVRDFLWDGFRLLPAATIARVRHGALEKFRCAVLRAEGRFEDWQDRVGDLAVPTGEWREAVRALRSEPLVQVEREGQKEGAFLVGRILRANKRSLALRTYDPFGRPGTEERIRYDEITSLAFRQPYLETLGRYLRGD